ncbi:recombinase family protein [Flavitalea sp. BT771]|uniref:recombinase family protein n=1 Tax=Flavitalea sp. BT771 TaxID=3063329 RepID=UPI0026E3EAA2|nr:recombinase family protein [Flavitalea sp. BT771]MDO6430925.1 recombinase family protein [Flavitalea sp. BT771]MDV6218935.1 recombinase family protein [Flavitalea sp. BT771]
MVQAVGLIRVSTKRQAKLGWSLKAQREQLEEFKKTAGMEFVKFYEEVVSGRKRKRPTLKKIIRFCRKHGATLVICKLDRLARNVRVILDLLDSGIKFIVAEKPELDRYEILRQAVDDEKEGATIAERTSKGLQEAKRNGVELGKNGKVLAQRNKKKSEERMIELTPHFKQIRLDGFISEGQTLRQLVERRIPTPSGKGRWHLSTVHYAMTKIKTIEARQRKNVL